MQNNNIVDEMALEAWKKTIDVQQHFNEICMKIRNVFATLLTGLCALIGVLKTKLENVMVPFFHYEIHGVLFILLGITGVAMLFYFIDRHWYHRLLVGSVFNGLELEKYLSTRAPGFELTSQIGANSPLDITAHRPGNIFLYLLAKILFAEITVKDGKKLLRSDAKLAIFYKSVSYVSLIAFIVLACTGGVTSSKPDTPPSLEYYTGWK